MNPLITITELKAAEVNRLLDDKNYQRFFPVSCNNCGNKKGFNRRIFLITGVAKKKQSDDATQKYLCEYFFTQDKIVNTFFRNSDKQFYADSASCQNCQSTSIVFDIDIDFLSSLVNFSKKNK